ncbi:MAG: twin-arginine translocase TatA/TatE family subunit [Thermoleophilia bacterium]|nr:twin-arginine translocase TatA/TatE family subunit [Thermoleophilia bacterium]
MFDISPIQIMLVLALALIVFGPRRLPELGRNLGKGLRDFKGGLAGEPVHDPDPTAARVAHDQDDDAQDLRRIITDGATPEAVRHEDAASRAA